jgi:hypothetical protein
VLPWDCSDDPEKEASSWEALDDEALIFSEQAQSFFDDAASKEWEGTEFGETMVSMQSDAWPDDENRSEHLPNREDPATAIFAERSKIPSEYEREDPPAFPGGERPHSRSSARAKSTDSDDSLDPSCNERSQACATVAPPVHGVRWVWLAQ